jgi:hypothetical protein
MKVETDIIASNVVSLIGGTAIQGEQITFNEMMMRSAQSAPKTTSPKPQSSKNCIKFT